MHTQEEKINLEERTYLYGHLLSAPTTEFLRCCRNLADIQLTDADLLSALSFAFGYISDDYIVQEEVALETLNHFGFGIKEDAVGDNAFVEEYTLVPVNHVQMHGTILDVWTSRFLALCAELTTEILTEEKQFALLEHAYAYGYEMYINHIDHFKAASEFFDYSGIEYKK